MRAKIVASSVEVICPKCDEPQPDPERGALIWEAYQIPSFGLVSHCVTCNTKLTIKLPKLVMPE